MRGEYNSADRGVYHYVTYGLQIGELERPSAAHEIVGWKVYHVKDASTYKDSSTWLEGTNDDGTTIAKDTIIYQAQWKEHKSFLFRIYDMNGNISMGLGKDFKMYSWKDSRIALTTQCSSSFSFLSLKTVHSVLIPSILQRICSSLRTSAVSSRPSSQLSAHLSKAPDFL